MPATWPSSGALRETITRRSARPVFNSWLFSALEKQLEGRRAANWLLTGGRGAGKTRTGAEWVNALVFGRPPYSDGTKYRSIALVGETYADVREVMIDGPSGIRATAVNERPRYEVTRRRLVWENGAVAQAFSSENFEALRGPQFDAAWCDELAKWKNAEECFDMLQFGMRLGEQPRQLITTTPRVTPLMKRLLADKTMLITRIATRENTALSQGFLRAVENRYGQSRLGRQELLGELIEDREDALWSRKRVEECRIEKTPELRRIVVALDPPASARRSSDACGIVAAGLDEKGHVFVLADDSFRAAKPLEWAGKAVRLYQRLKADCIVAEVNQGGDMVAAVIRSVDKNVPVRPVRAHRGKWVRAEPVALAYEQERVKHAKRFPELEDEMCDFGPNGLSNGRSPDRLDALVWAVTELLPGLVSEPRIRAL